MLSRRLTTLGLLCSWMLLGAACGGDPGLGDANVQILIQGVSSAPNVLEVNFNVLPGGEDVVFEATSRINATGQAEVDITVSSGGVQKGPDIPQIILASPDSGCIGCPENTIGTGSYTETGMTPGDYLIPLAIHYPGRKWSVSAAISLTLDQEPGVEHGYVQPAEQIEGGTIIVSVKPTNPEGPLTDLAVTAEFEGVAGSKVDLLDTDGDGLYLNAMTAPAAGSHMMVITVTNTVTGGSTIITDEYTTLAP